jgi:plasmid stability protein
MPNLSIKDVPESVAAALRQRAVRNHRSLQGELMALVSAAAAEEAQAAPAHGWQQAPARPGAAPAKTLEQVAVEHRRRHARPIGAGPRGTDVLRAERDAR